MKSSSDRFLLTLQPKSTASFRRIALAFFILAVTTGFATASISAFGQAAPPLGAVREGDYIAKDFLFKDGEVLPELRIHYRVLGQPHRNANGHVDNAVLLLHMTGANGAVFLSPPFGGVLFVPGGLLDTSKYFLILPDAIGHGKSSKPSDGLHAHFPKYDYGDMVVAEHRLVTDGLGVDHLRLILGASMGCMHTWMWGENYPGMADALMPLACMPTQIGGKNRAWRYMVMKAITDDPGYMQGEYKTEPAGLKTAADLMVMLDITPLKVLKQCPTRDAADECVEQYWSWAGKNFDANDMLYAVSASRNYDPSKDLEKIEVPLTAVDSADDALYPPDVNVLPTEIKRLPKGEFVLIPASNATRGEGTDMLAALWSKYLAELLDRSQPKE
jgi:homoserine O-acetyltransferase/O-succinyltransferase